jgi:hypothetical protein
MAEKLTFGECWVEYEKAHPTLSCRVIHLIGTLVAITIALKLISISWWYVLLVPFSPAIVYVFAWPAHRFIEHNSPTSWTSPRHLFFSIFCDLKMCYLMLTGRMW